MDLIDGKETPAPIISKTMNDLKLVRPCYVRLELLHQGSGMTNAQGESSDSKNGNTSSDKDDEQEPTRHNCEICQKTFSKIYVLIKHMRIHTGERPFHCENCDKSFMRKDYLNRHVKSHDIMKSGHTSRSFVCEFSDDKEFTRKDDLKKHKMRFHEEREKRFVCHVCQKEFMTNKELVVHFRTHSGLKPYECEICHRGFTRSDHLGTHMARIHGGKGEKSLFVCQICEKGFRTRGDLVVHSRTHSRQKPFVCQICQKGFTQSGGLTKHARTHTREKPFSCQICDKAFSESGTLKIHVRVHTGERPFICQICEKGFSQSANLNQHLETQHFG